MEGSPRGAPRGGGGAASRGGFGVSSVGKARGSLCLVSVSGDDDDDDTHAGGGVAKQAPSGTLQR